MRLLNTRKLTLEHFNDEGLEKYAILSHRWGDKEVSYDDLATNLQAPNNDVMRKKGWQKFVGCCDYASLDGYEYVWIDTCCIDKRSSAELSESLNSMYRYYSQASICYAYLADVDAATALEHNARQFKDSQWFTRGWTLQELVAPSEIRFLDSKWVPFGTKTRLYQTISSITGIDEGALNGTRDIRDLSIACRMSWAASRVTARIEDIAYCLMGIFDVNMPMLYGEGDKAFIRLQEEIIKNSNDHSIFAWSDPSAHRLKQCGLLAPHPRCFAHSSKFGPMEGSHRDSLLLSTTNNGLSIEMNIPKDLVEPTLAVLHCVDESRRNCYAAIFVTCIEDKFDRFRRTNPALLWRSRKAGACRRIYVRQEERVPRPEPPIHVVRQRLMFSMGPGFRRREDIKMRWVTPTISDAVLESESYTAGAFLDTEERRKLTIWRMFFFEYPLPWAITSPAFAVEAAYEGSTTTLLVGRQENGGRPVVDVTRREGVADAKALRWIEPEALPLLVPLESKLSFMSVGLDEEMRGEEMLFTVKLDVMQRQDD